MPAFTHMYIYLYTTQRKVNLFYNVTGCSIEYDEAYVTVLVMSMFQVLGSVSPLGIPSDGWLPVRNEMRPCPDSNSEYHLSLRLAVKYVTR